MPGKSEMITSFNIFSQSVKDINKNFKNMKTYFLVSQLCWIIFANEKQNVFYGLPRPPTMIVDYPPAPTPHVLRRPFVNEASQVDEGLMLTRLLKRLAAQNQRTTRNVWSPVHEDTSRQSDSPYSFYTGGDLKALETNSEYILPTSPVYAYPQQTTGYAAAPSSITGGGNLQYDYDEDQTTGPAYGDELILKDPSFADKTIDEIGNAINSALNGHPLPQPDPLLAAALPALALGAGALAFSFLFQTRANINTTTYNETLPFLLQLPIQFSQDGKGQ